MFVIRQSEETQHRRRALLKSYGNEKARNDNYMSDDETSDDFHSQIPADEKAIFNEMAATIQVDDWVGPVMASVEVWDKSCDGKPRLRDGPVVSFFDHPIHIHTDVSYCISIIPPDAQILPGFPAWRRLQRGGLSLQDTRCDRIGRKNK